MRTLVFVLAHPDDESFVGGGTLALYRGRGDRTALITLTNGEAGRLNVKGAPPLVDRPSLGALRHQELRRSVEALGGVDELLTPGLPDGALADQPDEPHVRYLVEQFRRLRADVVISFGPEGGGNGHGDHKATWRWTQAAFERCDDAALESEYDPYAVAKHYWITWPREADVLRGISGSAITAAVLLGSAIVERKRASFACHQSQQDHRELHERLLQIYDGKEYYHLGLSRVAPETEWETDLCANIELAQEQSCR